MRSGTSKPWVTSLALVLALASCTGLNKPLHGTHEDLPGGNVLQMKLMTPTFGWALTDRRLVSTNDAGKTWSDLTPIDAPGSTVKGAFFLDDTHVWCAALAGDKIRVYRSIDHGHSWLASTLPGAYPRGVASVAFDFVDTNHGWLATSFPTAGSSALPSGDLFRTTDSAETWTKLHFLSSDAVVPSFADIDHGILLTGPSNDVLEVTADGGSTWKPLLLTNIGNPIECKVLPCLKLDLPRFFGADGIITGTSFSKSNSAALVYRSTDSGVTWRLASTAPSPTRIEALTVITRDAIVWLSAGKVHDGKNTRATTGLPSGVNDVSFTDPAHGWARAGTEPMLYATTDGQSWTKLDP